MRISDWSSDVCSSDLILLAGVVAVPLATRLGLGSVLGYLLAGMAISPLLGILKVDLDQLQLFAEFGVVMMLFLVGLELEPKRLGVMRRRREGMGEAERRWVGKGGVRSCRSRGE